MDYHVVGEEGPEPPCYIWRGDAMPWDEGGGEANVQPPAGAEHRQNAHPEADHGEVCGRAGADDFQLDGEVLLHVRAVGAGGEADPAEGPQQDPCHAITLERHDTLKKGSTFGPQFLVEMNWKQI